MSKEAMKNKRVQISDPTPVLIKVVSDLKFGHFYFSWPPLTSATSEVRWQILLWILMEGKGKNLVYLHVKLSILSIGGA